MTPVAVRMSHARTALMRVGCGEAAMVSTPGGYSPPPPMHPQNLGCEWSEWLAGGLALHCVL